MLTRRTVVVGAAAFVGSSALLAACGDSAADSNSSPATATPSSASAPPPQQFVLVQRYTNTSLAPGDIRLAVSLAGADGSLLTTGPDVLTGVIRDEKGAEVAAIAAERRGLGQAVPYWSITATIAKSGLYDLTVDGAIGDPTPFLLFDPGEIAIPSVGAALPGFDTPTTSDARGVDPICTRTDGPCPFHEVTLNEALAAGKPVVYIVGTPAHCSTGTCAPGLEFLIEASKPYVDTVTFVHAEVYANPEGTELAPAVNALALDYEPLIWVTDAAGIVTSRIDIVWDADELTALLAAALS